jgi:hypothetical protein
MAPECGRKQHCGVPHSRLHRPPRHASEWRLTEFGCNVTRNLPTKDFVRWSPKTHFAGSISEPSGVPPRTDRYPEPNRVCEKWRPRVLRPNREGPFFPFGGSATDTLYSLPRWALPRAPRKRHEKLGSRRHRGAAAALASSCSIRRSPSGIVSAFMASKSRWVRSRWPGLRSRRLHFPGHARDLKSGGACDPELLDCGDDLALVGPAGEGSGAKPALPAKAMMATVSFGSRARTSTPRVSD